MCAAERRKEVIQRVFIGDVDPGQLEAPSVSVAFEEIVVANGGIEEIAWLDPLRILVVISFIRAGIFTRFEVYCEAGHGVGSGVYGVALMPSQVSPAWNSSSAVSPLRSTAGCPLRVVDVASHGVLGSIDANP